MDSFPGSWLAVILFGMSFLIIGTPSDSEGSLAEDRLALIELKLDESQKTISAERE